MACLHSHSWYSLLDGVHSPTELVEAAREAGYSAFALTDTNSLAGCTEFVTACRRADIHPVLGARLVYGLKRVTVLISEPSGYRSLCRAISKLNLDGDGDLSAVLASHHEGLHLLIDDPQLFRPPLSEVFRNRMWLELVRPGASETKENALREAASRVGARPVASTAARFATAAAYQRYRLLHAVKNNGVLGQQSAALAVLPGHHLATTEDLTTRFRDEPAALANAYTLAMECRGDVLPRTQAQLPCRLPPETVAISHLAALCDRSLPRFGLATVADARRRLNAELEVIGLLGRASYFLIAHEVNEEAIRQGWPLSLRGSAGSSLVCHLLGLTPDDPLSLGLRFERFLNAGRSSLPDIDIEFASEHRPKVFGWMLSRYGADHVARLGCYTHFRTASALSASLRANGLSDPQAKAVLASLGDLGDLDDERLQVVPAAWPAEPESWPKVLGAARVLEGRPRELSVHPCGTTLCADPVGSVVPIQGTGYDKRRMTVASAETCCQLGLSKFDILSSRVLSSIADAGRIVAELSAPKAGGVAVSLVEAAGDDTDVAALLAAGDTTGIAHLETPLCRLLVRQVAPGTVRELADALALARPGCASSRSPYLKRRRGVEDVEYLHASLEPILRQTLGTILYEDDALSVIEALAGCTATEADTLRRRLADRLTAEQASDDLVCACVPRGVGQHQARAIAAVLRQSEAYTFCGAHASALARHCWTQAATKARLPLAFWLASLNNREEGRFPLWVYIEEVKRAGLTVLAPCVNRSGEKWSQEVTALRAGLDAIDALSEPIKQALLADRQKGGFYNSFADFRKRLPVFPKAELAALVLAGGFDFAGRGRAALLLEGELQGHVPTAGWPLGGVVGTVHGADRRGEWQALGFCCGPPLMQSARAALPADLVDSRSLRNPRQGERLRIAGLVTSAEEGVRVLLDEFGLFDIETTPGIETPGEAELVLVEGVVDIRHGVCVLKGAKVTAWHPGILTMKAEAA